MQAESTAAAARRQQHIEALCIATIQALAGERDLHFRGRRLHRGRVRLPLYAAHLHPDIERDDFASFRGAADGLALRLSRSDGALHERLAPTGRVERTLFDMLEQFRVESLAGDERPGVQRNLQHRFDTWLRAFHHLGLTESASGLLMFTIAQVCHARVTHQPVLEESEDLMEATRAGIAPLIGHSLAALRRAREDQARYAVHALAIAAEIARLLAEAGEGEDAGSRSERDTEARLAFGLLADADEDVQADAAGTAANGRSMRQPPATEFSRTPTTPKCAQSARSAPPC